MTTLLAPHPFGHSMTLEQVTAQFSDKRHWEERYRQLILLSRQLPSLDDELKQQQVELKGCENRVWLSCQRLPDGTLHFYGDSEGRIVKGLLAVLLSVIEGMTPQQVLAADPMRVYQQLGISQELSASRGNGLQALIDRSKLLAERALQNQS
jgi:cysteine desulfuration protein SufE